MYHIVTYEDTRNVYLMKDTSKPDTVEVIQLLHHYDYRFRTHNIGHLIKLNCLHDASNIKMISGGEEILDLAILEAL